MAVISICKFTDWLVRPWTVHVYGPKRSFLSRTNQFVNYLLKMCGPQIRPCLFTFRPIASNKLNSLTAIDTLSWWCRGNATALCAECLGFKSWLRKGFFMFDFFVLLLLCFYFFAINTFLSQNFAIPFAMLINVVDLTYCKICDRL